MADELMNLENFRAALEEYGQAFAEQYKKNLIEDKRPASGKLIQSIKTRVVVNGQEYIVQMELEDYWKYLEYGTKGRANGNPTRKFPPLPAILNWIKVKPELPKPSTIDEWNKMAWAISWKIREFGTAGKADMLKTQMQINDQWKDKLEAALQLDMTNYIRKVLAPGTK